MQGHERPAAQYEICPASTQNSLKERCNLVRPGASGCGTGLTKSSQGDELRQSSSGATKRRKPSRLAEGNNGLNSRRVQWTPTSMFWPTADHAFHRVVLGR